MNPKRFSLAFNWHSLKLQMSLFVTLLFAVTTAAVAALVIYSVQAEMQENLSAQQYTLLQTAAEELDQEIALRRDALQRATLAMPISAAENADEARRFLATQQVLLTLFDRLHVFGIDHEHLADFPLDPKRPKAEVADFDFLTPTLHTGNFSISAPRQSFARDEYLVFFNTAVIDSEGFIVAILVGAVDLSRRDFIGALQDTKIGRNGGFRLVTGDRINLVHSNPAYIGERFPLPGQNPLFDRALGGWEGSQEGVSAAGINNLLAYKWLNNANWLLEAALPTGEVFAPIATAEQRIIWWTLGFGLLVAPLVWFTTQRLIAPLGILRDTIRAMRDNPGSNIEASIVQRNEIGELAREFNTMMVARSRAEEYARHMANHDPLTGLPNRSVAEDRVAQAIAHSRRDGQNTALLFLDLDNFKHINDSLGHQAGDYVLMNVAARLMGCIREGDSVARLGGDEFLVILSRCENPAAAALVATRLIGALSKTIKVGDYELLTSASMGIAMFPEDGPDVGALMRAADAAMYHAKEKGRNNYQFFAPAMNASAQARLLMEQQMRVALEREEFHVHYQTQVNLRTGQIVGLEALARWTNSDGPVSPAQFIPVAEDTGMIVQLGEWILHESCRQTAAWQRAGHHHFTISVNVSARQFQREDFVDRVRFILEDTGLSPQSLVLEITESVLMEPGQTNIGTLEALSAIGIQLSLDDFGTGYSSLSYLKRFPLQKLKIDRSFIRDIYTDPDDAAIVRAILTMAASLSLEVVAEGVETEEQAAYLRNLGCYAAQGYYYSKPVSADALSLLLKNALAV